MGQKFGKKKRVKRGQFFFFFFFFFFSLKLNQLETNQRVLASENREMGVDTKLCDIMVGSLRK